MNELSLPEKVSRVSTDEEATISANAVTESSSDVVTIESNDTYCIYFAPFFEDNDEVEDWVQCACKRWPHGDCMNDIVYDKYGRELFCPHCSL